MSAPPHYGAASSVITQTGLSPDDLAGIADETELKEFIRVELAEASDEINRFCNRTFFETDSHTETREGNGSETLQLSHYPVTNITSVEYGGTTLTEGDDFELVERSNYENAEAAENKGILKRLGRRTEWRRSRRYTFEYEAGYTTPPRVVDGVAEGMVIAGMREAIVSNQSTEQDGAQSVSMDGFSVTYDVPGALRAGNITEEQHTRLASLKQLGVSRSNRGGW